MKQKAGELGMRTEGRGLYEITARVSHWLSAQNLEEGLLTLFIPHTSASLLIQENADPDVVGDLDRFFSRLVKDGDSIFKHRAEGPDDMAAHVRSALGQTHLAIPVLSGRMGLGTWQGIYVFEHRTMPHQRSILLHVAGE